MTESSKETTEDWWDDEEEVLRADSFALHPGVVLKTTVLPARKVTAAALADAIGVARPGFNNMLNGKRSMTAPLALRIEEAIGYPAELLVSLQAQYELMIARRSKHLLVKRIVDLSRVTAAAIDRIAANADKRSARKAV